MPCVTEESKRKLKVSKRLKALEMYIRELMMEKHTTQEECASIIGISQGPFSVALKEMKFKPAQLMALFIYLDADPERLASIFAK